MKPLFVLSALTLQPLSTSLTH